MPAACAGEGSVVLLGVSKTQPAAALAEAWQAGLRVFGENRVQEGLAKSRELPPEIGGPGSSGT